LESLPGWRRFLGKPVTLLCGALVVHLLFITAPGWVFDVENFGTWMRLGIERGVTHVSEGVQCIYPPGYLYLLKGVGLLWLGLARAPLPVPGSAWPRFLVKIIPTLANVAPAGVLYRLAWTQVGERATVNRRRALIVMAAYAFNPAMVFISAVWGQA